MKATFIPALASIALMIGCAGVKQSASKSSEPKTPLARLLVKTYPPEALGIQVDKENNQSIRWKESIFPRTPVRLRFAERDSLSRQPRLEARLNEGQPTPFSIDTGAAMNMIDARTGLAGSVKVADPAVFKNTFNGLGGSEESYYAVIDDLKFGDLHLRNVLTVLRDGESHLAEHLDNSLGMTSLAKFAWFTIDYGHGTVTFAADGEAPRPPGARKVPFSFRSLQLRIEMKVSNEYVISAVLDTGNDSSLMLPKAVINEIGMLEQANRGEVGRFLGIGGIVETRTFTIPHIQMGEQTFDNVAVVMVPDNFPASIGSGIFDGLVLGVDFKHSKLWVSDSVQE